MSEISTGAGQDGPDPYGPPSSGARGPEFTPGSAAAGPAPAAPPAPAGSSAVPASASTGSAAVQAGRRSATVKGGLLIAAGLLAGVVTAGLVQGSDPAAATTAASSSTSSSRQGTQSTVPDGSTGMQPPGPGAGRGAMDGETHVTGTITGVGSDSVTVEAADGSTATYAVEDATQIVRNATEVALSDLEAGEQVLVHVLADGSGDGTAERVLVGTAATQGPGRGFGGPPPGGGGMGVPPGVAPRDDAGTQDSTGTTGSATGSSV